MDGARYLEDGRLTVFRRNGTYHARLRLSPGKYITRSLKTTAEESAVQAGRRLLFQLEHRAEQGLPPKSKLFAALIDDYIRFRERDHAHGKTSAGMLRQINRERSRDSVSERVRANDFPKRRKVESSPHPLQTRSRSRLVAVCTTLRLRICSD
jgi:hypothetical protein